MGKAEQPLPLPARLEATDLQPYRDVGGDHLVQTDALAAWLDLRAAAHHDGVVLHIVSAYRSIARQAEIVARKRARGLTDAQIYRYSAPPGHSEHHTGRALDLNTPGCPPLEGAFAATPAFAWLE